MDKTAELELYNTDWKRWKRNYKETQPPVWHTAVLEQSIHCIQNSIII